MAGRVRRFGREFWGRVTGHELMLRAAAIAFYSILNFIPILLFGVSVVGYLLGSSEQAVSEVMGIAGRLIPRATGPEVEAFIRRLIESRHITGVLGIGSLFWISMGLFDIVAFSLTALTGGRDGRSYLHRKLVALIVMGLCGFLFLVSLMASWAFGAWENIEALLGIHVGLPHFLTHPEFPRYVTSAFMIVLLCLLYRVAPVKVIRWRAILQGATLAGVLWHLVRLAFNWYLLHLSRYNFVYGILGGFVGLVLWIFYTAIILLLGVVFADLFDSHRAAAPRRPAKAAA